MSTPHAPEGIEPLTSSSGGLEGRAYLVTGGGSGIGRACAAALATDGAAVTICGRNPERLADAVARIAPEHGGSIHSIEADVTDEASVEAAVKRAAEVTGQLDGCIANAGGGGAMAPYALQEKDEFLRVLHLNVLGTMLCVKHTLPRMIAAGGGSFVGMSSIAAHVTHPYFGAYTVGKAGIEEMMRNAADEYGPAKIRFNAVRPGFIATELMEGIPRDSDVYRSYIENTPLGDVGEGRDVAALCRFLLGPEARWITGTAIDVDGGHHLRRGPSFLQFAEAIHGREALAGTLPTD
ncbi:MAG: SDR family oxidoreductase [Myxococcota bacterium]|jgi:NAD(P)-dependent dehydrogenase (short-subunit alcohol dehydrogenase family)